MNAPLKNALNRTIGFLLLLLAGAPAAQAAVIAYQVPAGTNGNQAHGGALGMDFDVNAPVIVTQLGVFDDGSDGLNRELTAYVWDRTSTTTPLATLTFAPADPGTPTGGSRFKALATPLVLPAGFQGTISADGYGSGEQNGNSGSPAWTTDSGGGALSFVGTSRYAMTAGVYPASPDGGPANRYAAGTFALLSPAITGGTGPGGIETTDGTSSLQLWLDANDSGTLFQDAGMTNPVTAGGQNVAGWADKSGNTHDATTSGTAPTYQTGVAGLGGQDVVEFNRSQLTVGGGLPVAANQDRTVLLVMDYSVSTGNSELFGTNTGNMADVGQWNAPWRLRLRQTDNAFSADNSLPAGPHVLSILGGGSGTGSQAWRDGTNIIDTTDVRFGWAMTGSLGIGGASFSGREYIGNLAEVIVYDRALNAAERTIVENALGAKYGLTLDSGYDRYAGDDPGNGDYDLDVFGIGRVDAANEVASAGSAGLAVQAGISLDDGDWLLAGHNVPDNGLVFEPTASMMRWDRVWYLDATGQTDAVLTFDSSDAGLGAQDTSGGYELLFSPTNAFVFQSLALAPLLYDDRVVFSVPSSLVQDGYYTLGVVPEPSTLLLAAVGGLLLVGCGRRKRRRR